MPLDIVLFFLEIWVLNSPFGDLIRKDTPLNISLSLEDGIMSGELWDNPFMIMPKS